MGIFNTSLKNRKVPSEWKHDIVQRIPKKNYNREDLTTLRDISLSSVIYKLFSRCIINRILPFIEPQIEFWQRAFLKGRNRQDLIFSLKTALDDFRHISTKLHILFIDFADAFGSIKHKEITTTLREYNVPTVYCKIIEHIYDRSSFQVICGNNLTQKIYITRGTKTGDPLSVMIFLVIVDKVLKPAFSHALVSMNIENERNIRPIPIQAYADDIAMVTYDLELLEEMIMKCEPLFDQAGLKVKASKCALFYERRSGNNWYKGKGDKKPAIKVQGETIATYKRSGSYKYLGKSFTIAGEDEKQVKDFIKEFKDIIDKIKECTLPIPLKLSAFNNMALAKISHHFENTKIEEKQLEELDTKITKIVKEMFDLYPKSSDKIFFVNRLLGGLGIKRPSNVYRATRSSNLIKMLNHDEENIRYLARKSLELDMKSRGVRQTDSEINFLGYALDANRRLAKTKTYGGNSDWPDLLFHANKFNGSVIFKDGFAVVVVNGKELNRKDLKREIEGELEQQDIIKSCELHMQGNFIGIENIDKKISHQVYYGWKLSDSLVKFILRARMNQIPCNQLIHMWNKDHDKRCSMCNERTESVAHLMNSCRKYKDLYSRRHDRVVEFLGQKIQKRNSTSTLFVNKMVETALPHIRNALQQLNQRKPDILEIKMNKRECEIVEVTVCFDLYMDTSYEEKGNKYQPLINLLNEHGIATSISVMCFGSLGTVHKNVRGNLKRLGLSGEEAKETMKWCSVSNMICGSIIWRNRCKQMHGQ